MRRIAFWSALVCVSLGGVGSASAWRSTLYPESWTPGTADGAGRRLGDFSYAGYHAGVDPIPDAPPGPVVDVTGAPYLADPSGVADATAAIQAALDDVGAMGGGVVYLPAGTYRVAPPPGAPQALLMRYSGVVLRGAGPRATFLFNDATDMRDRRILSIAPRAEYFAWWWGPRDARALLEDAPRGASAVRVADASDLVPGELVLIGSDATAALIAELGMTGTWTSEDTSGPIFYRRVVSTDASGLVELDAPLRFALRARDAARLFRPELAPVREVGVEHLAIGNRENLTSGTDDDDHARAGTGAYAMHASFAIYLDHVVDGWIADVATYRPAVNTRDVHVLSNTIRVDFSLRVTLAELDLANPQYQGAGGNGYHLTLTANDTLVRGGRLRGARHNVSISFMHSSGNVVWGTRTEASRLPVDFHQRLAFENLLDSMSVDDDSVELAFRDCCGHGHGTTESVVWNLEGLRYPSDQFFERFVVDTQQLGNGYVIGTRGPAPAVRARTGDGTSPVDLVEGEGEGDTLEPRSLYADQLARRLGVTPELPDAGLPPARDGGVDAGSAIGDAGVASRDAAMLDGGTVVDAGVEAPGGCAIGGHGSRGVSLVVLVLLASLRTARAARGRHRSRARRGRG